MIVRTGQAKGGLPRRRGFTLMETALATVIVGVGVVSVMELLAKCTTSQDVAVNMSVAVNLANNVHELMYNLSFTDPANPSGWGLQTGETYATAPAVNNFDGAVFSPPIDVRRQALTNYANWSQSITVHSVDPNNLSSPVPDGSSSIYLVTVVVSHAGQTVFQESWLNASPY